MNNENCRYEHVGSDEYRTGLLKLYKDSTGVDIEALLRPEDRIVLSERPWKDDFGPHQTLLIEINGSTPGIRAVAAYERHGWDGHRYKPNCMHKAMKPDDPVVPLEAVERYVRESTEHDVERTTGDWWTPAEYIPVGDSGTYRKNSWYGKSNTIYTPCNVSPPQHSVSAQYLTCYRQSAYSAAIRALDAWSSDRLKCAIEFGRKL